MSIDEEKSKLSRQHKYDSLKWSSDERIFQHTRRYREEIFANYTLSFTSGLYLKYKKSILGSYLDIFNLPQNQDKGLNENKLGITQWEIKRYNQSKLKRLRSRNAIFEDYIKVLNDAVRDLDVIDLDYIKDITTRIELTSFYINLADADLRKFVNVRILILIGNNLRDLQGACLPDGLLYLELYDNFISDLKNIVKRAPKNLLHLGLGRNKLNDDSSLHLLTESGGFKRLRNLDLSSNDIYKLEPALAALAGLKSLKSFSLEGNPCSVVILYKAVVLFYLPQIVYLDNHEVLDTDRSESNNFQDGGSRAQVIFKCHRIVALPKPPKDNKSIQTIHVEVELPLLEEIPEAASAIEKNHSLKELTYKDIKKLEKSKTFLSSSANEHSTGKNKKPSPYASPDEYSAAGEKNNFRFKSVRMPWQKIIEFPPILIEPPEMDLVSVRDTFRSTVNVSVIYLKVAKPTKSKNKDKGGKKEMTSSKSSKSGKASHTEVAKSVESIEDPGIVLRRITLCKFVCDMTDINWSDETVDFYWADHESIKSNALRVDGCLKAIKYAEKGAKPKPKEKKTGSSATASTIDTSIINPLPKVFTCQVGFGLTRSLQP